MKRFDGNNVSFISERLEELLDVFDRSLAVLGHAKKSVILEVTRAKWCG